MLAHHKNLGNTGNFSNGAWRWVVAAKFEIRASEPGGYHWVLISQGRTLATSASYTTRASAEKAIASMRQAAADATVADLTLPAPKTQAGTVARAAGRVVARAVVRGGQAVEQGETTMAETSTENAEVAKKAAKQAKAAAKKAADKAKSAAKKAKDKAKKPKGKGKKAGR